MPDELVITPDDPKDPKQRVQMKINRLVMREMRVQAAREECTIEQLAEKAFKRFLDFPA